MRIPASEVRPGKTLSEGFKYIKAGMYLVSEYNDERPIIAKIINVNKLPKPQGMTELLLDLGAYDMSDNKFGRWMSVLVMKDRCIVGSQWRFAEVSIGEKEHYFAEIIE